MRVWSRNELDAEYLAVPPNDIAASGLATVEEDQLKAIRDARGQRGDDFRAIPGYIHDLTLGAGKALHRDPRRYMADPANLSGETFR
jgi:hypothetical protein